MHVLVQLLRPLSLPEQGKLLKQPVRRASQAYHLLASLLLPKISQSQSRGRLLPTMELPRQVQRQSTAMAHHPVAKQGHLPMGRLVHQPVNPKSKFPNNPRGRHPLPKRGGKHRDKRRHEHLGLHLLISLLPRPHRRVRQRRRSSLCQFEESSFKHAHLALRF